MKILTGELRGRSIAFKARPGIRPTADKVRKAIFDMLQGELGGKKVLDLFSGTGALGLEALSLGADHVTFVENDKRAARRLEENLIKLGLHPEATVIADDALRALRSLANEGLFFELVFLDPPYGNGLAEKTLRFISSAEIVRNGGLIMLECGKRESFPAALGDWEVVRTRLYGDTKLILYRAGTGAVDKNGDLYV